jgi:hypothetical protein
MGVLRLDAGRARANPHPIAFTSRPADTEAMLLWRIFDQRLFQQYRSFVQRVAGAVNPDWRLWSPYLELCCVHRRIARDGEVEAVCPLS